MGEEGLICMLLLVLLLDPVAGFMVTDSMLLKHDLQGLLCFLLCKFAVAYEDDHPCMYCEYTFFWLLSDIGEYFISIPPKMFSVPDVSLYGIKNLYGDLLVLWSDESIVDEGLQDLSVFSFKHHFELLPAHLWTWVSMLMASGKSTEEK